MRFEIEIPIDHNAEYLDHMVHDLTYEAVRQSELFVKCDNDVVDAKADQLAQEVKTLITRWIDREVSMSFPLVSPALRSLTEAQEESEAA